MQILSFTKRLTRGALLLGAATLFASGQATQSPPPPPLPAAPTPPAQKPGPPVPAGTGGPGGTISEAERMQKSLAIGEAPDPAAVSRGKNLFVATCGFCHGANANGGESGPNLVRSVLVLHDKKSDQIGPVIHGGRPAQGMPAFPAPPPAPNAAGAPVLQAPFPAAA